jgi:CobQ-like glutamine amidotransferase family enzyme
VLGTYSHGPALSRNPALADLLLRWAIGVDALPALDDTWADRLRAERLAAAHPAA